MDCSQVIDCYYLRVLCCCYLVDYQVSIKQTTKLSNLYLCREKQIQYLQKTSNNKTTCASYSYLSFKDVLPSESFVLGWIGVG